MDSISKPLKIFYDNSVAVFLAKNDKSGSRSKHIDIKYLAIREHVKEKKVVIEHINTKLMIANPLIKDMSLMRFKDHVNKMRIISSLYIYSVYETLVHLVIFSFSCALNLFEKIYFVFDL